MGIYNQCVSPKMDVTTKNSSFKLPYSMLFNTCMFEGMSLVMKLFSTCWILLLQYVVNVVSNVHFRTVTCGSIKYDWYFCNWYLSHKIQEHKHFGFLINHEMWFNKNDLISINGSLNKSNLPRRIWTGTMIHTINNIVRNT